jgi:hypothetical protein
MARMSDEFRRNMGYDSGFDDDDNDYDYEEDEREFYYEGKENGFDGILGLGMTCVIVYALFSFFLL